MLVQLPDPDPNVHGATSAAGLRVYHRQKGLRSCSAQPKLEAYTPLRLATLRSLLLGPVFLANSSVRTFRRRHAGKARGLAAKLQSLLVTIVILTNSPPGSAADLVRPYICSEHRLSSCMPSRAAFAVLSRARPPSALGSYHGRVACVASSSF